MFLNHVQGSCLTRSKRTPRQGFVALLTKAVADRPFSFLKHGAFLRPIVVETLDRNRRSAYVQLGVGVQPDPT